MFREIIASIPFGGTGGASKAPPWRRSLRGSGWGASAGCPQVATHGAKERESSFQDTKINFRSKGRSEIAPLPQAGEKIQEFMRLPWPEPGLSA